MAGIDRKRHLFFNDTATTEIYTLSLHDALPIWKVSWVNFRPFYRGNWTRGGNNGDGRSLATFLRSEEHTFELQSHSFISYAVFCLKKKSDMPIYVNYDSTDELGRAHV